MWWLLATLALVGLGLVGWQLWSEREARMQRAIEDTNAAARSLGGHVTRILQGTDALIRRTISLLEAMPEAQWSSDRALWTELRALATALPGIESMWVLDAEGRIAVITSDFPPPPVSGADRDYFLAHKRDGKDLYIGPAVRGRVTKGLFFTVSRPIRDAAGRFRGTAVAAVDIANFVDFQRQHGLGDTAAFVVARTDGELLVRQPALANMYERRLERLAQIAAHQPEGARILVSALDGLPRIVAHRRDPLFPVVVAVSSALDDVLAPWRRSLWTTTAAAAVVGAFLSVAALLAHRAGRREEEMVAELKRSHEDLERMVEERTAAQQAERQAAQQTVEQLRFALGTAQAGTWEWDMSSRRLTWSDECFRLYGLQPADRPPSREQWVAMLHPDDRQIVQNLMRLTLANRAPSYRGEYRVRHPDGSVHWLSSVANLIYDDKGEPIRVTGLNIDVTGLKQAEAAMREAKIEAERANIAKSKFLAAASHDLRQPFQAMRLFYEVLAGQLTDPRSRHVASKLNEAMRGGEELLSALLDVSTLDAGTLRVSVEVFPLSEVIDRVVAECEPQAAEKGLRLRRVHTDAVVLSDRVLLARMLRNLVVNAIRYTREGGILVGCRQWGNALKIEVWDTGIGIPPEKQALIFEDFYQVGNEARDRSKGLGLGLSVVARMGRLLGHPVEVRSRLDKGSVFAIVLPRAALPVAVREPAASEG
jgi:PAS domain S-box-containing protein